MLKDSFLAIEQQQSELNQLFFKDDYYWYLRSPQFIDGMVKPIAAIINKLPGLNCLDCACGEALLGDYVDFGYLGFDGSVTALDRAHKRNPKLDLIERRLENPPWCRKSRNRSTHFGVVVFSGILETLIKPSRRMEFLEFYRGRYDNEYFLICDLDRLNTSLIEERYHLLAHVNLQLEQTNPPIEEVKLQRKILLFGC